MDVQVDSPSPRDMLRALARDMDAAGWDWELPHDALLLQWSSWASKRPHYRVRYAPAAGYVLTCGREQLGVYATPSAVVQALGRGP